MPFPFFQIIQSVKPKKNQNRAFRRNTVTQTNAVIKGGVMASAQPAFIPKLHLSLPETQESAAIEKLSCIPSNLSNSSPRRTRSIRNSTRIPPRTRNNNTGSPDKQPDIPYPSSAWVEVPAGSRPGVGRSTFAAAGARTGRRRRSPVAVGGRSSGEDTGAGLAGNTGSPT